MKITYDKSVDALYIKLTDKKVSKTRQIEDGIVMDFDADGVIIGIEILYPLKRDINPYEIAYEYLGEPETTP